MYPIAIVASLFLALAAESATTPGAHGDDQPPEFQEIAQARPHALSVEVQQVERGHFALTAWFRHLELGAPGKLRIDLWNAGEHPIADPRVHTQLAEGLTALPPDPLAKNPACGVTKWGLKALVWIAGAACCSGTFWGACAACAVGGGTALDAINGIDCNKECKPDCPIA